MRKFLVKAANIPEPDRSAAITTATKLAEMVARLACYCSGTAPGDPAGVLLQHAAAQLLPAFQVRQYICVGLLRSQPTRLLNPLVPAHARVCLSNCCTIRVVLH
jgi:hypothetical protein